jgi:ABC-type transporter Mla subunit MlaD
MNDRGDMLRVATNVEKADGNRAIGTYIPHTSPVVQTVLSGKTFSGRAFVVDRWYITAYEPLRDDTGDVVGVLYVGIPQEKATALREAIMDYVVGETGYVFVLNATGRTKGHYVISQDGERDGEDIWDASDADGRFFIQEMCETATGLSEGEATDFVYPWKQDGETEARNKIARVMYFEPWDWVIGASCYTCEYNRAKQRVAALGTQSMFILGGLVVGAAVLAFLFWYGLSGGLSKTIGEAVAQLTGASDQVEMASQQVAESSQQLAAGASQQAASVEEASSSLEELTSMTRSNLENASQASERATQSRDAAHRGREAMERMTETIGRIKTSADETAQILRTIDEIAFQTNLLALNAAVEAARAGDAGKGFAVVAEEVRNLALRSAEAASRTGQLIEDSQKNADNGVNVTKEMSEALGAIVGNIDEVTQLAQSVTQATEEQTRGIDQINKAVAEVDKVTQISAATSEESASASEELSSQAVELRSLVEELDRVVQGARAGNGQHLLEAPVNRPHLTGPESRAVIKR